VTIDIDKATPWLLARFVNILKSNLAGELTAQENDASGNYPLPAPEHYIVGRDSTVEVFRRLNIDEVGCWVSQDGPSETVGQFSGSPDDRANDQDTSVMLGLVAREPAGVDPMPTTLVDGTSMGRELLMAEWLGQRAHLFKGALINTVAKHIQDPTVAGEMELEDNQAQGQQIDDFGRASTAVVTFTIGQDVLIPR